MAGSQLEVLVIGDPSAGPDLCAGGLPAPSATGLGVRRVTRVADARSAARDGEKTPQLVVVVQAWPDQFTSGDVIELLTHFPLARLVCCQGPWCDSDGRTRDLWPAACRVPLEIAPSRIAREIALIGQALDAATVPSLRAGDRAPPAWLPLTASRGEIFEARFSDSLAPGRQGRMVAVESPDRQFRIMLERALGRAGFGAAGSDCNPSSVHVWDADPWNATQAADLRKLRSDCPNRPLVACVGFGRPDLADELRAAGASAVWCKLAPLATLCDLIGGFPAD
ncbi:MAG: hypothetical protein ACT4QC_00040 [Planctomycetaceae bacterium]